MKLDVLAFGAHPDDVELSCSGTLYKLKKSGKRIGIVDLTRGELGTRGTAEIRASEAAAASSILELDARENLDLGDGWLEISKETKLKVIEVIRKYKPTLVLANAVKDRHIDHPKAAELIKQAAFLSGLKNIVTTHNGEKQEHWRPKHIFNYIQYYHTKPDLVIDITSEFDTKLKSILAYKSQFYNADDKGPQTPISTKQFLNSLEARAREFGAILGIEYGEGFTSEVPLSYDLTTLL
jgi:bacillithiol biosynthesis deacetylase BshB1